MTVYCRLLLLSLTIMVNTSFAVPQVINKMVAVVHDNIILESDINVLIKLIKLNDNYSNQQYSDNKNLYYQILERLIMDHIILQIGKKTGVQISDEQLDYALNSISRQNNLTIDQIRSRLSDNEIAYSTYRNQIYKEILISEIRNNEVRRRIVILPHEIYSLIKQIINNGSISKEFNLSHIFIPLPINPTTNQITKIKKQVYSLVKEARDSNNLHNLITNFTINEQSPKLNNIGWKNIQALPSIFSKDLNTAKIGDVIGPIYSKIGFHILKVNDLLDYREKIYITEIYARHILLKPSLIMTDDQAQTKLKYIASNINDGKITFADAAKKFSQDIESANQGGELGWMAIDIYDPALYKALIHLNKNQLSTPIRSSIGWHLIELLDTRKVDKTHEIQKNKAYDILYNRKFSEEVVRWMQEQRSSTYVKILSN